MLEELWRGRQQKFIEVHSLFNKWLCVSPAQHMLLSCIRYCRYKISASASDTEAMPKWFWARRAALFCHYRNGITFLTQVCLESSRSSSVIWAKGYCCYWALLWCWLGCHLHTHKGSERNLAAVNGEGEMKAVPPGWFCWPGFCLRRLSDLLCVCTHVCVISFCMFLCAPTAKLSPVQGLLSVATFRRLPILFSRCRPLLIPML